MNTLEIKGLFLTHKWEVVNSRMKDVGIPRHKRRQIQRAFQKDREYQIPKILEDNKKGMNDE